MKAKKRVAPGSKSGNNTSKSRKKKPAKVVPKRAKKSGRKAPVAGKPVKQGKNRAKTRRAKSPADYIRPWMWKPGQSGNPKGRPRTNPITEAYRNILEAPIPDDPGGRTFAQAIAQVMLADALSGNVKATREITDRVEGRPKQTVELSTGAEPLHLEITSALDKVYGTGAENGADPDSEAP